MNNVCPVCGNIVQNSSTACEMCGFKLVGATQEFRAIDQAMDEARSQELPIGCMLRVLRGPQIGMTFKLESDTISIGRNPHCDVFLNDMTVSRKHAILTKQGNTYRINDDNSFNGVWINGKLTDNAVLKAGDTVQIGAFRLAYEQE